MGWAWRLGLALVRASGRGCPSGGSRSTLVERTEPTAAGRPPGRTTAGLADRPRPAQRHRPGSRRRRRSARWFDLII